MKILTNKFLYLSAIALFAVMASGLYLLSDSTMVSAQKGDLASRGDNKGMAREDQLAFALRLGAAADYTVFGAKGVRGSAASISGKSGSGMDEASLGESGSGLKARSDLNKGLAMIKQLPCREMEAALTGGTFEPGVYCTPSAALAGQMTLSGEGRFVFLIEGAMKSADNFQLDLQNGAKAGNVYFVADTASLGAWNTMSGSVIARGSVDVGAGTKVNGRAFSKEAEVVLADGANLALAPGYIQICKFALHDGIARAGGTGGGNWPSDTGTLDDDLDPAYPVEASLRARIFQFQINGGNPISVPVGSCSSPIEVIDATAVVTELNTGTYLPSAGLPQGTIWTNRFRLVNISARTTQGQPAPILTTDLRTRSTSLSVPTADSANPVILDFTNTFAIPAVIEICKFSADATTTTTGTATLGNPTSVPVTDGSVAGFFDFTVNTIQGRVFSVPVGFCTGPIFMDPLQNLGAPTVPFPQSATSPAVAIVAVTEIAEPGFTLESASILGGNGEDRQVSPLILNRGLVNSGTNANDPCAISNNPLANGFGLPASCYFNNPGGGYVLGLVYENITAADQTIFRFFNRTNPGVIKICKIAGPGIQVGTRFEFEVRGRQAQFQAAGTGNAILPGADIARTVTVTAGPPAQGGNCSIVTDPNGANTLFIVGTLAYVREVAVLDDVPGVQSGGFGDLPGDGSAGDGPTTDPASEVRVSRIRVNDSIANIPAGPQTVGGNTQPTCTTPPTGMTNWWMAEGNAFDSVGIGHGTVRNGAGFGVGVVGQAFTFPGGTSVVDMPAASFDQPTTAATIDAWVYPTAHGNAGIYGQTVFSNTDTHGMALRIYQGRLQADFRTPVGGTNPTTVLTGPVLPLNEWTHVAITYDGTVARSYVNGVLFDTRLQSGPITNTINAGTCPTIGNENFQCVNQGAAFSFKGSIDEVEVFDRALDASEILAIFEAGGAGKCRGATVNPNPNLATREVIFRVNRGETVVEYTNILFQPTQLKICKVAGTGIAVGTPFTFTITVDDEGGLVPVNAQNSSGPTFPAGSNPFTIPAGDPALSAQGNCIIVDGPYGRPGGGAPPLSFGTFRVGSRITVSETGAASSVVITTPTGPAGALTVDAANRRATLQLGYIGGFNELIFVNSAAAPVSTGFSLAGRVMTPDGGGLRNAQVILTKSDGTRMTVPTSSMGYYSFSGLANETYTVSVSSRRYRFTARSVDLNASLANVDFTGIE